QTQHIGFIIIAARIVAILDIGVIHIVNVDGLLGAVVLHDLGGVIAIGAVQALRSEERRVGYECDNGLISTLLIESLRCYYNYLCFISSRRRHTSSKRDWSSDVCSSDLQTQHIGFIIIAARIVAILDIGVIHIVNVDGLLGAVVLHDLGGVIAIGAVQAL